MATSPPCLAVEALSKGFRVNGHRAAALEGISFAVGQGEVVAVLGPSGCGKTTLLNLMAGFIAPDQGRVLMDGREVSGPGPQRGVVFQEDALFPWLTVRENLALGLRARGMARAGQKRRVEEFLELVGLGGFGDYLPREISGGMKQRVALARVLVMGPRVLLMDEPFAALDAQTREDMHGLFMGLQARLGQTVVLVTHDLDEAVRLADRVLVLGPAPGRVVDVAPVDMPRPRQDADPAFLAARRRLRLALGRPATSPRDGCAS